ncbi:hypothetical protein J6590_001403 [Homalodisca vitripennis]|nr:hypothetical protein J6590_001403 [Homalodisca vitripennis]
MSHYYVGKREGKIEGTRGGECVGCRPNITQAALSSPSKSLSAGDKIVITGSGSGSFTLKDKRELLTDYMIFMYSSMCCQTVYQYCLFLMDSILVFFIC